MTPLEFLQLLRSDVTAKGYVEFRFLKGGIKRWMPWPCFPEHPDVFLPEQTPQGKDAYFGVALRQDQTDGKAANCLTTNLLWADVDLIDHPEFSDGLSKAGLLDATPEELAEMKASLLSHLLSVCEAHQLPPRAVVDSGHGLQVYWARKFGIGAEDTERLNKMLAALLGGDPRSTDIARILRVPGTENRKNPARPLPVQVVYQDENAVVTEEALPQPQPEKPAAPAPNVPLYQPGGTAQENYARRAFQGEVDAVRAAGEGNRNNQLNISAVKLGSLIAAGALDEIEVVRELTEAAQAIGLEPDEIRDTLRSGLAYGKDNPRDLSNVGKLPPSAGRGTIGGNGAGQVDASPLPVQQVLDNLPAKPGLAHYRDLVLADFHQHGFIYRYHQVWRNWWEYQQGVYVEVPDEVMSQKVDLTLQSYGFTLKNSQVTEVMVKIGRDPLVGSRLVDQGAWELNTRSGVLDLASGGLYEHTPDYFSIIQSAATYEPFVVSHEWLRFLREAVPDEGDRELLQMFAGLCLTGDTSPQRALLLVGDGGTGKSTFVRVLQAVLGNLSTSSALENIRDGSFLVGTLVGKRMCVVSELQRNVDWLPFKRVTGEDQISVDVKNKTPYTTKLDLKLIILSNVMPFLGDDTSNSSLMRRFLPVPFNVRPAKPDPTLEARLTDPDELPGVLNWMLEGLKKLRERGMRFPASDTSALAREIVEESNRVITFLQEECQYVPESTVTTADLYDAYRKWCGKTGHGALNTNNFAKQLLAAGRYFDKPIEKGRTKTTRYFTNLMLSTNPGGWDDEG